jgi:hypothetical protein
MTARRVIDLNSLITRVGPHRIEYRLGTATSLTLNVSIKENKHLDSHMKFGGAGMRRRVVLENDMWRYQKSGLRGQALVSNKGRP